MKPTESRKIDIGTLAALLRETEKHHADYEKTHGKHNWWDWYAAYLHARQNGASSENAANSAAEYLSTMA